MHTKKGTTQYIKHDVYLEGDGGGVRDGCDQHIRPSQRERVTQRQSGEAVRRERLLDPDWKVASRAWVQPVRQGTAAGVRRG